MKIIFYILVLLPVLLQADSNPISGEWIGMNTEHRLILNFNEDNSLEIDLQNKKPNSIYPQIFGYQVVDDNVFLTDEKVRIDSFQIVKLEKNELIVLISEIEMAFHKPNMSLRDLNLDSYLSGNSFIINYSNKINSDTIIFNRYYQFGLRNGTPCESLDLNIMTARKINSSIVIDLTINNEFDEIFVEEIRQDEIIGIVFFNSRFERITIKKIDGEKLIDDSKLIQKKIFGKWVWITDKEKFLELKEKKNKTIYINYRKIQFLDNFEYIENIHGQEYRGGWRVERINGIWIMQFNEGDPANWGGIFKIKEVNDKYIITENIDDCNYSGHRNTRNEFYYIKE